VFDVQRQLLAILGKRARPSSKPGGGRSLRQALLAAFPDRVCCRRSYERSGSYTICTGQGFVISENGLLPGEQLILALRLDQSQRAGDGRIFLACALEESLLADQHLYQRRRELFFSRLHSRVTARERVFYGKLILRENETAVRSDETDEATEILIDAALADQNKALALDVDENASLLAGLPHSKAARLAKTSRQSTMTGWRCRYARWRRHVAVLPICSGRRSNSYTCRI